MSPKINKPRVDYLKTNRNHKLLTMLIKKIRQMTQINKSKNKRTTNATEIQKITKIL